MKTRSRLLGVTLAALSFSTVAPLVSGQDAPAAYGTCIACHGADGGGNAVLKAPALAGQDAAYLTRQLEHFKAGIRGSDARDIVGRQMQPMAAMLPTPEAAAEVSAYLSSLPPNTDAAPGEHDTRNGEVQYNAACGACHGPTAAGNPAFNAPNLTILDEAYLRRQMAHFKDGVRGGHPDDKYGRQMAMMATMLSTDKDLNDVIGFILAQ
ncbi:MAG: c-type cytochrome [Pseudomonadota bacterium]